METLKSERNGPMLDEFGGKKERTRKSWTSFRSKTAKREAFKSGGAALEWRMVRQNKIIQNERKWYRKLLGKNFLFVWKIQHAASAEQAGSQRKKKR